MPIYVHCGQRHGNMKHIRASHVYILEHYLQSAIFLNRVKFYGIIPGYGQVSIECRDILSKLNFEIIENIENLNLNRYEFFSGISDLNLRI